MATYRGKVSVKENKKHEIVLKPSASGKFDADSAEACYARILAVAKSEKLVINEFTIFTPKDVKKGDKLNPVMLANRYGNPYIALLPEREGVSGKKLRNLDE